MKKVPKRVLALPPKSSFQDSSKMGFQLKNYRLPDKYGTWLGYRATHLDRKNGTARLELTLREDHLSPAGRIHGGVISGFFDFACGAAVFSTMAPEDFCSTVELKVNYFSPLDKGDKLTCRSQVMFRGRKLCVVHALLYRNKEKKPVAMATATFNVVSLGGGKSPSDVRPRRTASP